MVPKIWFGLISLFNDLPTFVDYLMPIPEEEEQRLYLSRGIKLVHTFPKSINTKMNLIK